MAKGLKDLARELEKKASSLNKNASQVASEIALAIVSDLALKTPVDTSKAISNWQTSLDAAKPDNIPPHYPGESGSTFTASAAETIAAAKLVLKAKKPGQTIYITNNLPYIRRLNYEGYSSQEPAGFVERAVLIGRKVLEKNKGKYV